MATYGSLLLETGGGIIDHNKQAERQPGATVVIGLGGTGKDAVQLLKRKVYKDIKPDNVEDVVPEYQNIQFLVIDSDDCGLEHGKSNVGAIDNDSEFFSLSSRNIKELFKYKTVLRERMDLTWLNYESVCIDDAAPWVTTRGIRQIGRFLLVANAEKLFLKIKNVIADALFGTQEWNLTIHICSGICGGTGGGILLDVCYLVRAALAELGRADAVVNGYLFMPDVNLSVPQIACSQLAANHFFENGYATLKEFDYCMDFDDNKDSFKMNYGFNQINESRQPVDVCYLISVTEEDGKRLEDGYNYAMDVVSDFIIHCLARIQPPAGVDAEQVAMALRGYISRSNSLRRQIVLSHGTSLNYNILGASVAKMPISEIATYLGYKLFEGYADIYEKVPTEKERDDFLRAAQLKYHDIRKALSKGCKIQAVDFSKDMSFFLGMFKIDPGKFIREMERGAKVFLDNNKIGLEQNTCTLLGQLRDYTIPKESTSLISRTYKGLCEKYLTQLEYGPFYAQRMICGSQNQNLVHAVDGFIKETQSNLEAEIRQADRRADEYDEALARMQSANFFITRKRLEEYLNALNNLYVHHYKIFMLQTMHTVLQEYRRQLVRLNNKLFDMLTRVLDTLRSTFKENGKFLVEGGRTKNSYTWNILSVSDISEMLEEEISNLDLQQVLDELMTTMLNDCESWIGNDETKIRKLISDFVLKTFPNATQKTIIDYLKLKYCVDNDVMLARRIQDEIFRKQLEVNSTPLFWKNTRYSNVMGMHKRLTVPYDATEIKQAAYSYQTNNSGCAIVELAIEDRVSMFQMYSGIPLCAYQIIYEMQDRYERRCNPGRHLYESDNLDWNTFLPSLIPASMQREFSVRRIEERNRKLMAEFEMAERDGVIVQDTFGRWLIKETEDFDAEEYLKNKGLYNSDGEIDVARLDEIIADFEDKVHSWLNEVNTVYIKSGNAAMGAERQVMLDFYLKAPVLNELVRDELSKRERANALLDKLHSFQ